MLDATGLPRGSAVHCGYTMTMYSKSLNPTPHISRSSSVGSALGLTSNGSSPLCSTIFFFNNVRLLA